MYQGMLRFTLAMIVVYAHYFPNVGHVGKFAVMGFFLVSGYLITRVINGRYSNGVSGLYRFGINRFLRIYPTYWACLLVSLAVILAYPEVAIRTIPRMNLPDSVMGYLQQFTIFGLLDPVTGKQESMFIPVAWSLNVELAYYIAMSVFLVRKKLLAVAWFVVSILLMIFHIFNSTVDEAYFSFDGPMVAFASGALLYFYEREIKIFSLSNYSNFLAFIASLVGLGVIAFWQEPIALYLIIANSVDVQNIAEFLPYDNLAIIYSVIPVCALALYFSMRVSEDGKSIFTGKAFARINSELADLSYPVFLLHPAMLICVTAVMGGAGGVGLERNQLHGLIAVPLTVLVSFVIVRLIEKPIHRIRDRVRPSH